MNRLISEKKPKVKDFQRLVFSFHNPLRCLLCVLIKMSYFTYASSETILSVGEYVMTKRAGRSASKLIRDRFKTSIDNHLIGCCVLLCFLTNPSFLDNCCGLSFFVNLIALHIFFESDLKRSHCDLHVSANGLRLYQG